MNAAPIPKPVMDELLNLVRRGFDHVGNLTYLAIPAPREITETLPLIGGRNIPHSIDDITSALINETWRVLPGWRTAHIARRHGKGGPTPVTGAPATIVAADATPAPETWEARIRTMPYPELARLCETNGIDYKKEAPNPGILTMRARNACYNAIKAGKTLK